MTPTPFTTLEIETIDRVRTVWLNRPDVRNAMNAEMIAELDAAIAQAIADDSVRVIVLAGRGKVFCAGGDLTWMKAARDMPADVARQDSANLANVLRRLYQSPKPTVACVHGSAFAGAMGLVCSVDVAIASDETRFCISEVKLGLIPAMISPYVIRAIGERQARRLMLTAEVIQAPSAHRIGLIHDSVPTAQLQATLQALLRHLLAGGPSAMDQTKSLIHAVSGRAINDSLVAETAARIGAVRASDEAQEGIAAFFDKRPPAWLAHPSSS